MEEFWNYIWYNMTLRALLVVLQKDLFSITIVQKCLLLKNFKISISLATLFRSTTRLITVKNTKRKKKKTYFIGMLRYRVYRTHTHTVRDPTRTTCSLPHRWTSVVDCRRQAKRYTMISDPRWPGWWVWRRTACHRHKSLWRCPATKCPKQSCR